MYVQIIIVTFIAYYKIIIIILLFIDLRTEITQGPITKSAQIENNAKRSMRRNKQTSKQTNKQTRKAK
jgi:hypothetical protein